MNVKEITKAVENALTTPNETDRNGEAANVVDGLFAIARALDSIAVALLTNNSGDMGRDITNERTG